MTSVLVIEQKNAKYEDCTVSISKTLAQIPYEQDGTENIDYEIGSVTRLLFTVFSGNLIIKARGWLNINNEQS